MGTIYEHLSKIETRQERIVINCLDDFFDVIKKFGSNGNYIYRGVNSKDTIYPKIIRKNECDARKEFEMLEEFENYSNLYESVDDCWELVSLAQHNGLATRLIDFTFNINVAFFFSLYYQKNSNETYEVFVEDQHKYSTVEKSKIKVDYKIADKGSYTSQFKREVLHPSFSNSVILTPKFFTEKVLLQQGLFLMPICLTKKYVDEMFQRMPFVIVIEEKARDEILNYLRNIGFDVFRLMPGIENVCNAINKKFDL